MQQRLKTFPEPHGQRSFRPSFFDQFFIAMNDTLALLHMGLGWITLPALLMGSKAVFVLKLLISMHDTPPVDTEEKNRKGMVAHTLCRQISRISRHASLAGALGVEFGLFECPDPAGIVIAPISSSGTTYFHRSAVGFPSITVLRMPSRT